MMKPLLSTGTSQLSLARLLLAIVSRVAHHQANNDIETESPRSLRQQQQRFFV